MERDVIHYELDLNLIYELVKKGERPPFALLRTEYYLDPTCDDAKGQKLDATKTSNIIPGRPNFHFESRSYEVANFGRRDDREDQLFSTLKEFINLIFS